MSYNSHFVIIGAGPIGLTAAAHLARRQMDFTVLEAGPRPGASIREWGHVLLFSPWALDIDPEAVTLLAEAGWSPPPPGEHPTGIDLVERYVEPLADHPAIGPRLRLGATVTAVTRRGRSRLDTDGRDQAPFVVRFVQGGTEREIVATAVIDASGTWSNPNPLGAAGIPARGERVASSSIRYGIPDVLGANRAPLRRPASRRRRGRPLGAQRAARSGRSGADRARHEGHLAAAPSRRGPSRRRRRQ